jgi:SMODS-associated and fused to various effectors sensor domain
MAEAKDVTRYIKREVERELWARAAGRCQFDGCNRIVFKSPVTQERLNISEKAHIYSYSKDGPRGWGPFVTNKKQLNDVPNLMLLCHDCHEKIDAEKDGGRYSAKLLQGWKAEHEKRIGIVTGVHPSKKSNVLLYGANIGDQVSMLQPEAAKDALFPDWYPSEERPVCLSMSWEGKDTSNTYWKTESQNLEESFNRQVRPLIDRADPLHFSIFSLAPMPLMVQLGSLLTDKVPAQVYQLHREPAPSWKWKSDPDELPLQIVPPKSTEHPPALVISMSGSISHERVRAVLGESVSIWELSVPSPHNDLVKSKQQLSHFRENIRSLMVQIAKLHGFATPLSIFPAMPVSCAIELGRVRMPKADLPWVIFDHNIKNGGFVEALRIG